MPHLRILFLSGWGALLAASIMVSISLQIDVLWIGLFGIIIMVLGILSVMIPIGVWTYSCIFKSPGILTAGGVVGRMPQMRILFFSGCGALLTAFIMVLISMNIDVPSIALFGILIMIFGIWSVVIPIGVWTISWIFKSPIIRSLTSRLGK